MGTFEMSSNTECHLEGITEEERKQYWYSKSDIEEFEQMNIKCRDNIFHKKGFSALWGSATGAIDVAEIILESYNTCCRAKSENSMQKTGELIQTLLGDALIQEYARIDLPGLEPYVLSSSNSRGSSRELCRFMLDHAKSLNGGAGRQQWRALSHVSECVSRPSRILAHELAKSLHEAII